MENQPGLNLKYFLIISCQKHLVNQGYYTIEEYLTDKDYWNVWDMLQSPHEIYDCVVVYSEIFEKRSF